MGIARNGLANLPKCMAMALAVASMAIVAIMASFAFHTTAYAHQFPDVADDHWAASTIDRAVERGLFGGYPDGRFGPQDNITRAQIAAVMRNASGEDAPATTDGMWEDVDLGAWYGDAMKWAWDKGLLTRKNKTTRPNDPISREELCAVLLNYARAHTDADTSSDPDRLYKYPDSASISGWATESVSYAVEQSIIGNGGALNPHGNATRAEAAAMLLTFSDGGNKKPALLKSCYIDVGQGDAIYVELPNGSNMLIDAGTASAAPSVTSTIAASGRNSIDVIVMTHPDADHIGGMSQVLSTFDVGRIYAPDFSSTTQTYTNLMSTIAAKGKTVITASRGTVISHEGNMDMTVMLPISKPTSSNAASIVILADYNGKTYLYTGDAEASSLASIIRHIDVLKVSHHGSNTGTTEAVMRSLTPTTSVISVGAGNSHGHPTDQVMSLLSSTQVYRTDHNGSIESFCDGSSIWFNTTRNDAYVYTPPSNGSGSGTSVGSGSGSSGSSSAGQLTQVCITRTGEKFHRRNCATLKRSTWVTYISRSDAIARGYEACKVCKP